MIMRLGYTAEISYVSTRHEKTFSQVYNSIAFHIKFHSPSVPRVAPVVSVSDRKSTSSLMISWTDIPEEDVNGKLLGYHITYKPIKISDQNVDEAEAKTVTMPASGRNELSLESLSSFTRYNITVAGYTAAGDGKTSEAVLGGKNTFNYILQNRRRKI